MPVSTCPGYRAGYSAFLGHAPFYSGEPGVLRARSAFPGELGTSRSRSVLEHKMDGQLSSCSLRRSTTTVGELPPLSSNVRVRSARQTFSIEPNVMPRSHVSVARFYDWSEDLGDCFSVSRLYREIANIPRLTSLEKQGKLGITTGPVAGIPSSPAQGVSSRLSGSNAGRMFIRDKKALTRGEREIIEGIYKNRGDVSSRDAVVKSEYQVKSHLDAWYAGKHPAGENQIVCGKVLLKGERIDGKQLKTAGELDAQESPGTPGTPTDDLKVRSHPDVEPGTSGRAHANEIIQGAHKNSSPLSTFRLKGVETTPRLVSGTCLHCQRDGQDLARQTLRTQNRDDYWDARPSAPPTTPDHSDPRTCSQPQVTSSRSSTSEHAETRTTTQPPLTFDKLLGFRPNLLPNSILVAEKIRVQCGNTSSTSRGDVSQELLTTSFKNKIRPQLQVEETNNSARENGDFTKDNINSLSSYHDPGRTETNGFDLGVDSPFAVDSNQGSGDSVSDNESEKKKFQVKVYLPQAGSEQTEEDTMTTLSHGETASLTRERPLSHNEFAVRNVGQPFPDSLCSETVGGSSVHVI